MNYFLRAFVIHENPEFLLSEMEFTKLRDARRVLRSAFALEEIFDLLLANYRELEIAIVEIAVEKMTSWKLDYENLFETRSLFNQRTLNLLSSARVYVHQFPQWLKEVGASADDLIQMSRDQYDLHFEYRFMEALRNHAQHVGLAVHEIKFGERRQSKAVCDYTEFYVMPYVNKSLLASDGGFKPSVLKECPEKIPLLPAARRYVESLGMIHREVRKLVEPLAAIARETFQESIDRHCSEAAHQFLGLTAFATNKGKIVEQIPIHLEWDDIRLELVSKNETLVNLSRRYVSRSYRDDA